MSDFPTEPSAEALPVPEGAVYTPGVDPLPLDLSSGATVVLLLAGQVDRDWAARTAIELCTGWAAAENRVVLADMHVEDPVLHEMLGVRNMEGMVDIFLYGASISRSARPVDGRGFHLLTAGTYEVDTESIYRNARWAKLVAGFREANASLVVFAPADAAGLEAISSLVEQTILLGAPSSGRLPFADDGRAAAATMLVPPGYSVPAPALVVRDAGPEHEELRLPPQPVRRESRTRRGAFMALAFVLLVLLLAAAGFALARYRPDLVPWLTAGERTGAATAGSVPAVAPVVRRAGETVPFAVLVRSYASLGAAQQQVQAEQRRFTDTPFYISPEDDSGVLYYKVYAGLLRDTASAERLRERLLQSGAVDSEDTLGTLSLIHRAHLSFDLGEYRTRDSAQVASDSLGAREIPTYAVPMPYEDGSRRWQLYGGAYRDSATADAMRRRLTAAGLAPRLVLRVGEPAPRPE
jgi:hypothetical protein